MNETGLVKKRTSEIVLLVIFSLLISLTLISGCTDSFNPRLFTSAYEYNLQIQSDTSLHNVTFIIPLPVRDGAPLVGNQTLTAEDFRQPGVSAVLTQSPPDLNMSGAVSLPAGYQPWFVVIRADELAPANGSSAVYTMKKDDYIDSAQLSHFRVTPDPVGTESLIVPKFNFTWKDPEVKNAKRYAIWYNPYQIPQETQIYADYNTTSSARVTISFSYFEKNMWFEGYDDSFSNKYQDQFIKQYNGEKHEWNFVNGTIKSVSDWDVWYPNATNPEWQQVLNNPPVDPSKPPSTS